MKFIIPLLFVSTTIIAQPTFMDFKIDDEQLVYQHVFDTSVSISAAKEFFITHPVIKNVQESSEYLVGEFQNVTIDFRKYGRTWGNTPILFTNNTFSGKVKIEIKRDKYRLTVFGITYAPIGSISSNSASHLSVDALKKDKLSIRPSWATSSMLGLLNDYFWDAFTIRQKKSDW